jgi:hypothetical protein
MKNPLKGMHTVSTSNLEEVIIPVCLHIVEDDLKVSALANLLTSFWGTDNGCIQ